MAKSKNPRGEQLPVKKTFKVIEPITRKAYAPSAVTRAKNLKTVNSKALYYNIYRKHPWFRAFVTKLARIVSNTKWGIVYVGEGEPDETSKTQIRKFFAYPNPYESFCDILYKTTIQLKIFNTAYWEVVKDEKNVPVDFYTLDGNIVVKVDKHGFPERIAYIQKVGKNEAKFSYDEIIRFVVPDPQSNLDPSSDMEALEKTLLLDINAMNLNHSKQKNGVRSGKAFIFKPEISPEQMKRNEDEIHNLAGGVSGAFSAFLALQGDLTVQDLKFEEVGMEQKELREYCRDEISAVTGVPVAKMGLKNADLKEGEYLTKTFFIEDVWPLLQLTQSTINRYFEYIGLLDYEFRFEPQPSRDYREIARFIDVLKKYGVISVNEARELAGLSPVTGGDDLFVIMKSGNIIIVDDVENEIAKFIPSEPTSDEPEPEEDEKVEDDEKDEDE